MWTAHGPAPLWASAASWILQLSSSQHFYLAPQAGENVIKTKRGRGDLQILIMTAALTVVIANFMSCLSGLKTKQPKKLLASSWSPFLYPRGVNPEPSMSQASTWGAHECRLSEACLPNPTLPHTFSVLHALPSVSPSPAPVEPTLHFHPCPG